MSTTSPRPLGLEDHDDDTDGQADRAGQDGSLRARLPRAASAVGRARLSVVPRLRSRAPRVPFVALVSVLMLAGVVGLLLFNTSMQQASFAATRLEAQARTLSAQEQSLTMQLDKLRDPQQLALRAQAQGLVPPSSVAFLDVETGEVTGEASPAQPGDGLRLQEPAPRRPADLDPAPATGQGQDQQGRANRQDQGDQPRLGREISPQENPLAPQGQTQTQGRTQGQVDAQTLGRPQAGGDGTAPR